MFSGGLKRWYGYKELRESSHGIDEARALSDEGKARELTAVDKASCDSIHPALMLFLIDITCR